VIGPAASLIRVLDFHVRPRAVFQERLSYYVVSDAGFEAFAPVVAALTGR
jgi:hypothetical protein